MSKMMEKMKELSLEKERKAVVEMNHSQEGGHVFMKKLLRTVA